MKIRPLAGKSLENFAAYANTLHPDEAVCERAVEVVAQEPPVLLGLSGWPTAGKDVLGVEVMKKLNKHAEHLYFAVPMKDEVDAIIAACRGNDEATAVNTVTEQQGVSGEDAEMVVEIIHQEAQNAETTSRTRTPQVRKLLQVWGTNVRRRQDNDYWVRKALKPAVEHIANSKNVYVSDVRFVNEIEGVQKLGFTVIRLEIDFATVKNRLLARDNMTLTDSELQAMLAFPSESTLNDYEGFDLKFTNEGTIAQGVETIVEYLKTNVFATRVETAG